MHTGRFSSFIPYCLALLALLSFSACDDPQPPPAPADPGTVARQVIADFLSLPITEVTLVSLEAQDFSDSSLGCPEPDMAYQQVVTPGHRATVEAEGRRFDVRIAGSHGKICRNKKGGSPARAQGRSPGITVMVELARRDLATILGIEISDIRQLDIRPYDSKNPPAGCTPECTDDGKSCGYIIGLFHEGRRYDYHAVNGEVKPCPPILRM